MRRWIYFRFGTFEDRVVFGGCNSVRASPPAVFFELPLGRSPNAPWGGVGFGIATWTSKDGI